MSALRALGRVSSGLAIVAALAGCGGPDTEPATTRPVPPEPAVSGFAPLVDRTAEVGLDFEHFNGMTGELHIVEEMGSGAALFDFDRDGDLDLYLVQGARFAAGEPLRSPPARPGDRLYRNELAETGSLRFTDVSAGAGLGPPHHGMGVAAGDYDADGWTDLYITAWGSNRLLRNLGAGRFADVTSAAGADDPRWSVPAAFVDIDADDDLDLYVGNYLELPPRLPPCENGAREPDYCGPSVFTAAADRLLVNRGDGTFADATAELGLASVEPAPALGVVTTDLDGDGRVDLFVANDGTANHLWIGRPGGFVERGLLAGVAVNAAGKAEGSMGVDAADPDADGDLDLLLTHLIVESNTLYLQRRPGQFEDATAGSGLGGASRRYTAFGAGWLDFDRDGWLDLLVVNGAVNRLPDRVAAGDPYPLGQANQLFRNLGPGAGPASRGGARFVEVPQSQVPALAPAEVSRGAAFGDVDNDGDLDVVVTQSAGPARLLINPADGGAEWVGVRALQGSERLDAPGAQVSLIGVSGDTLALARVRVEGSYASASDPRVIFSLGPRAAELPPSGARVRVSWPDGALEEWTAVPLGRYSELLRGSGQTVSVAEAVSPSETAGAVEP